MLIKCPFLLFCCTVYLTEIGFHVNECVFTSQYVHGNVVMENSLDTPFCWKLL